jgi:hypothetical protein
MPEESLAERLIARIEAQEVDCIDQLANNGVAANDELIKEVSLESLVAHEANLAREKLLKVHKRGLLGKLALRAFNKHPSDVKFDPESHFSGFDSIVFGVLQSPILLATRDSAPGFDIEQGWQLELRNLLHGSAGYHQTPKFNGWPRNVYINQYAIETGTRNQVRQPYAAVYLSRDGCAIRMFDEMPDFTIPSPILATEDEIYVVLNTLRVANEQLV